jgi:starch synthase
MKTPTSQPPPLKVLAVASEMFPLVKTGGLADVVGALPAALGAHGIEVGTLLPGYPAVMEAIGQAEVLSRWEGYFGGAARLLRSDRDGMPLIVLDAPHLYARPGNPYLGVDGRDWPDNAERFAALACAAARIGWGEGGGGVGAFVPDVLHLHDWQAALAPAYLRYLGQGKRRPATLLTLHNMAFQGQFKAQVWSRLGLPAAAFSTEGVEYHGDVGYLKAGIQLADAITTVSPTYAQEICTAANGMGLDAMLRWRGASLSGIVNGIDTDVWDPATDSHLKRTYGARSLLHRQDNKRAVEDHFRLPHDASPLLCMISRLTSQKGIDLVSESLNALVDAGARLVVLGNGDAKLEAALRAGAKRHPTRVAVHIGYDEALSHLMQGGCDAIVVPSRFEPCGLTQLCGLRYGCVPVVTRVGGLADTVIDANDAALKAGAATGIQFSDITAAGLMEAVRKTVRLYRQPAQWQSIQRAGMRCAVGWQSSAADYAALYRRLAQPQAAAPKEIS